MKKLVVSLLIVISVVAVVYWFGLGGSQVLDYYDANYLASGEPIPVMVIGLMFVALVMVILGVTVILKDMSTDIVNKYWPDKGK